MVGGEEDGHTAEINDKLYTTVEDGLATVKALGSGEKGRYLTALTFGNVHGVYKPGAVKLRPSILADIQKAVGDAIGKENPFDLVFHGGSGSTEAEISEAVDNGVIKMNIDTDTQYAFSRPVADHFFRNYDGVLKVDGEVGNKKAYDPRAWGKLAEAGMAAAHRRGRAVSSARPGTRSAPDLSTRRKAPGHPGAFRVSARAVSDGLERRPRRRPRRRRAAHRSA